ncbi:MAG: hypothetical protein ACK4MQ_11960 [Hyphomonas sp.]
MLDDAPRPELWTRIAALLGALRTLLMGAAPHLFAGIAREARAQLAAANALVRRYLHVLAAELTLPPAVGVFSGTSTKTPATLQRSRETLFRLTEEARPSSPSSKSQERDPPELQWALMVEAVRRLRAVLNDPRRHALRLARLIRRKGRAMLRVLPVPAHILRRLPPWTDALICRLDQEARPADWAGLDTS